MRSFYFETHEVSLSFASVARLLSLYVVEWSSGVSYEEEPASAAALTARLGGSVDVIFAADCIFQTLFGDAMPLLDVLLR